MSRGSPQFGAPIQFRLAQKLDSELRERASRAELTIGVFVRQLVTEALEGREPPKVKVVAARPEPAPGHVHTFVRHLGDSGLFVWTCDCGERSLRKPVS